MTPFQIIVGMVMDGTGLRWERIIGDEKNSSLARARWAIIWAVRETSGLTSAVIASKIKRDQSTVRHARREATKLRESDPAFKAFTDRLVAAVPDKVVPE